MNHRYIKVFSAERTGSVFTIELLNRNIIGASCLADEFGWRHGVPQNKEQIKIWSRDNPRESATPELVRLKKDIMGGTAKILPVILIKNPYTWYKSIYRYRRGTNLDLNKEYKQYNQTYKIYMKLLGSPQMLYDGVYGNGVVVKYEDIIQDPKKSLDYIGRMLKIKIEDEIIVPKKVEGSEPLTKWMKEFYLSEGPWKLAPSLLKSIENRVNWKLMANYGYKPVKPEKFYPKYVYKKDEVK